MSCQVVARIFRNNTHRLVSFDSSKTDIEEFKQEGTLVEDFAKRNLILTLDCLSATCLWTRQLHYNPILLTSGGQY